MSNAISNVVENHKNVMTEDRAMSEDEAVKREFRIAEFIRFHCSPECDQAIDYDDAYAKLAEHDSEAFDVFVRLSYYISEYAHTLSTEQLKRLAAKIANLAVSVLSFNLSHVCDLSDTYIDAVEDAKQPANA